MNNIKKVDYMSYPDGANMDKALNEAETEEFYFVNFKDFTEDKINCVADAIEKAKALTAYMTAENDESFSSAEIVYVERANNIDVTVQVVATVNFNEKDYTWEILK